MLTRTFPTNPNGCMLWLVSKDFTSCMVFVLALCSLPEYATSVDNCLLLYSYFGDLQ